jgi:hypothetical protein
VGELESALKELAGLVTENLGGTVKVQLLDKEHREIILDGGEL